MRVRKVLDSRARWTVELDMKAHDRWVRASVPAGKSKGRHEAVSLPIDESLKRVERLKRSIVGRDFKDQKDFDRTLGHLAGERKEKLGVDLTLAASIAFYKLRRRRIISLPTPMFNVINGGLHAGNFLAVQEFMVVPRKFERFSEKLEAGVRIYLALKEKLEKRFGRGATNVGDEGGFAPPLEKTEEALGLLEEVVGELGLLDRVSLSIDCAASSYFDGKAYAMDGRKMDRGEYIDHLSMLAKDFHLFSVEDPLHEEDFEGFAEFLSKVDSRVVGDDLTVTSIDRVLRAHNARSVNAVLIKPNQVGTVSEAEEVMRFCDRMGWTWIISHRSGETTDPFIARFAAFNGAPFIKAGAPARGERVSKYNELLRMEELL